MKSRKELITEPDDRRWLEVSSRTAAAGGLVVVALLGAMALLHPGERAAVDSAVRASVADVPVAGGPPSVPDRPASGAAPIATDADGFAPPDNHPPTF
jgi:hypothetical protein